MFEVGAGELDVSVCVCVTQFELDTDGLGLVWPLRRVLHGVADISAVDSGLLCLMFQSLILLQSWMETGTQSKSHHLSSPSIPPPPPHLPVVEQITSPVGEYFPSEL